MRTYERGVENETLSCGTGVTAAALAHHILHKAQSPVSVHTPGGDLSVTFDFNGNAFSNIHLKGPVAKVFTGVI
jgi:diaminopimelate epimerase